MKEKELGVLDSKRNLYKVALWLKEAKAYLKMRIIVIGILGFISALPLPITASTLTFWLSKVGVDYTSIGLFALAGIPYVIKFLWAPLVDRLEVPLLTRFLGQRKSWIVFSQLFLIVGFTGLALTDPLAHLHRIALWTILISVASATLDIAADAYRIERLESKEYGMGAAINIFGYRMGLLTSGAGAIIFATYYSWFACFIGLACIMLIGIVVIFLQPRTLFVEHQPPLREILDFSGSKSLLHKSSFWFKQTILAPFQDFMNKPYWVLSLIFILTYKASDGMLAYMATPFYNSVGFTPEEIVLTSKIFGVWATAIGGFVGGLISSRLSMAKALFISAIFQALSNGLYLLLSACGHNLPVFYGVILAENIFGGISTIVFVAYLCHACNVKFAATQYALMSAFASVPRTIFAAPTGFIVAHFGWNVFFITTIISGIPAIYISWLLIRRKLFLEEHQVINPITNPT